MAIRSANAYVRWIRRFILTNDMRHPGELGECEVEAFLTGLAVRGQVAALTQNQALPSLRFLYGEVLGCELSWMDGIGERPGLLRCAAHGCASGACAGMRKSARSP